MSTIAISAENTLAGFGKIKLNAKVYRPLEDIEATIACPSLRRLREAKIWAVDSENVCYLSEEIQIKNKENKFYFTAAGALGTHTIFVDFGCTGEYDRIARFRLEADTSIATGVKWIDELYPRTRESLLLNVQRFNLEGEIVRGYITADSGGHFPIWLRDVVWQFKATKYWDEDLHQILEPFFSRQHEDGSFDDWIDMDGKTCRCPEESDVEYIAVLGVYWAWQATGDDKWMSGRLPQLEKGLKFALKKPGRFDPESGLVTRTHGCDTWDFNILKLGQNEGYATVANCDQSGYYLAARYMARMYQVAEEEDRADRWNNEAERIYTQANSILWDGVKYLHHVHIDNIDHGNFNEQEQLSMGNVWAIVRGMANHKQAVSIIEEYRTRYNRSGWKYPWISLNPPYPLEMVDRVKEFPHIRPGGYINGGLLPYVGGELAFGSFLHGYEKYAVELMRQYFSMLEESGDEVYTWYWPDGQPGIRTTNTTHHDGWGMAPWVRALVEGLAGVESEGKQFEGVKLSPRWPAAHINRSRVSVRFGSSLTYVAYEYEYVEKKIMIRLASSGKHCKLHLLLPEKKSVSCVSIEDHPIDFKINRVEDSWYLDLEFALKSLINVEVELTTGSIK